MAKIGTAHVEIKPVLNEEALNEIVERIELTVRIAVSRAMQSAKVQDVVRDGVQRALNSDPQAGITNPYA